MPKKPRSQRRKKGTSLGTDEDGDLKNVADVDVLSEDHTVADSVSLLSFVDDFNNDGGEDAGHDADPNVPAASSSSSSPAHASSASLRHTNLLDALSLATTITTEKRSAKREQLLRRLFKAITQCAVGEHGRDAVLSRLDDAIVPACFAGLRGGGGGGGGGGTAAAAAAEQYAACRVLEATSVILGGNHDSYCESIDTELRRVVLSTGRASLVRGAALRALSMAHFVCGTDMESTRSVLVLCEAACDETFRGEDVPPALRATALDCWALLSTTVEDAYLAGDEVEDEDYDETEDYDGSGSGGGRGVVILPLLRRCLDHSNVELRSAGGECVALIHEARLNLGINDDEGENTTERRYRRGSWDGTEWEVLMDEVKQRVAELSIESGHHMSKKAKKEQRATFREFMSTIVDDESPSEIVNFRGGQLSLNSWKEIIQLNFIRHCLQSGFQIQLMTNSTLHVIFGSSGNFSGHFESMSQLEKRLLMSKTSQAAKAADVDLTRRRRNRTNMKNHFLTSDGDDI